MTIYITDNYFLEFFLKSINTASGNNVACSSSCYRLLSCQYIDRRYTQIHYTSIYTEFFKIYFKAIQIIIHSRSHYYTCVYT